jgi:hypothetical protein
MTAHQSYENLPAIDDPAANTLIASMNTPGAFSHPVSYIRLVETHISWILLTGTYAYKIKKPVDFGFLDFSTLEKRRYYCEEELRLNRRFAPQIYLDVVAIRGSETAPQVNGKGEIIEYAVKMLEFPQHCLLSSYAGRRELSPKIIDAIAERISEFHAHSDRAEADKDYGSAAQAAHWSQENLVHIATAIPPQYLPNDYFALKRWYRENLHLLTLIDARKTDGFVRECHGDLHLGNMALIDDEVTLFDCIEFNPELRWIDTVSEAAFVAMDLHARGYPEYCWRFLNRYFESNGDYAGVELLRYYFVYRALVRAKVEALRVEQEACDSATYRENIVPAIDYIELAAQWAGRHRAGLIIMHGLSGSGKSTVAAQLAEALGALQVRSDVERKRLFDLAPTADSESALGQGIYNAEATKATYRRLGEIAAAILAADFTVIVDATLLKESQRRALLELESIHPCNRIIIDCEAPESELRRRIVEREQDASEANLEVLTQQLRTREALSPREREIAQVVSIDSSGLDAAKIDEIRNLLFS